MSVDCVHQDLLPIQILGRQARSFSYANTTEARSFSYANTLFFFIKSYANTTVYIRQA
jgi:hypothetical protein